MSPEAVLVASALNTWNSQIERAGLGDAAYPEMFAAFVKGADKDVAVLPTAAELRQQWADVNARTSAAFGALTPAGWLERHTQVSAEDFATAPTRNRFSILLTRTSHIGYHLGQVVIAPK
jgi:hypothetical protein